MGVMDKIFGARQAPKEPLAQQNPTANTPAVTQNQPTGTSLNPAPKESTPLDDFKDLWQPAKVEPDSDPFSKPLLTHDPAKFNEAVGKMNFAEGISADQVQKAMSDPQEFIKLINGVGQRAFAASAQLGTQLVEGSHKTNNERINATLPKRLRQEQVSQTRSDNPLMNHDAVRPILDMAKSQIAAKNPDLTPAEVQARAENYVNTFTEGISAAKTKSSGSNEPDPSDFSNWGQ